MGVVPVVEAGAGVVDEADLPKRPPLNRLVPVVVPVVVPPAPVEVEGVPAAGCAVEPDAGAAVPSAGLGGRPNRPIPAAGAVEVPAVEGAGRKVRILAMNDDRSTILTRGCCNIAKNLRNVSICVNYLRENARLGFGALLALLSAGLLPDSGFDPPPPKSEPPAGVVELVFPNADVVPDVVFVPPKRDPAGLGAPALPKIDCVFPAGVVLEVVAGPPPKSEGVVDVVAGAAEVVGLVGCFPKMPPPNSPPLGVLDEVVVALLLVLLVLLVFPNMLPPVAGVLVLPNKLFVVFAVGDNLS